MTTVYWVLGLAVGAALWALLIVRAASLVPFAKANMQARQQRIEEALKQSEESKRRLADVQQQIEQNLAQARAQQEEILRRAREEAVAVVEEISRRGRADADALIDRARTDIAIERDRALQELRAQTAELIVKAAGSAVAQSLDATTHQRLIDEALQSLGNSEKN